MVGTFKTLPTTSPRIASKNLKIKEKRTKKKLFTKIQRAESFTLSTNQKGEKASCFQFS